MRKIFGILIGLVIYLLLFPFISFWIGYFVGWLSSLVIGNIFAYGISTIFHITFLPSYMPLLGGIISWIASFGNGTRVTTSGNNNIFSGWRGEIGRNSRPAI